MVIRAHAACFDRARARQHDAALQALKVVLAGAPGLRGMPATDRAAAMIHAVAVAVECTAFDFNNPVSVQKYILIMAAQSKWAANPLFWHYARRMIGLPDQVWRLESGVAAVYRNGVAQHFPGDPVKAHLAAQHTA